MNVQSIFIIDKKNNMLIFLDVLDKSVTINQQELAELLGLIVSNIATLELNTIKKQIINGKNYTLGNFEKIILILQHEEDDPIPDNLLKTFNKSFNFKFSKLLDSYTEADISQFKAFKSTADGIIEKFQHPEAGEQENEVEEEREVAAPKPQAQASVPPPFTEDDFGRKPLIKPIKREAYPDGIADYMRDEVLWEESQSIRNEYFAEFVEGMIHHLQIFLSISLTHHYELVIDFSNYPMKPTVSIGKGLLNELGKPLEELLFFLKNWDTKIPPHIIEIVREFEALLMKFKALGKLSDTDEMPESALPDLEPLPELPPLEEEESPLPKEPEPPKEGKEKESQK